jgi:hypothetical protein
LPHSIERCKRRNAGLDRAQRGGEVVSYTPQGRRRDFQRQKPRNPARCHRTIVSGRTIVTASRMVGASRYSNTKIKRSKDVRAGRLGALRRSTCNWCRSAITSPSSALLDRKKSRRIHLSRLKSSSTWRSSPDSVAQTKWMGFAVGTGSLTKRDHKRMLWTIERMKRLVTERIAGEQFVLKEAIL